MTTPLGAALLEAVAYHLGASGGFYQDIIQKRFGLTTTEAVTLQMLAGEAGCSRERIRQIETQFISQVEALARAGNSRFPSLAPVVTALRSSDGTWADATRRVAELFGYAVYLPNFYRLIQHAGNRLPPVGFGPLVQVYGHTPDEVRARLNAAAGKAVSVKDIAAWSAEPHKINFEDAPTWAIDALKGDPPAVAVPKALPADLDALPQRELMRVLMLRSGYTRKQMMGYLGVNRSTFDRWLWPATNPTPLPPTMKSKLAELAEKAGPVEKPRTRHLGPPKQYALEGIPGCARKSRARETGALIILYKTDQADLPASITKSWATVCDTHKVAAQWDNFATGLRAMAQAYEWCPDCAKAHAHYVTEA